jgi:hypothetical protein
MFDMWCSITVNFTSSLHDSMFADEKRNYYFLLRKYIIHEKRLRKNNVKIRSSDSIGLLKCVQ